MERLWAPWRMQYIKDTKRPQECILCILPKGIKDEENLILYRGKHCFIILNLFPYNDGHLMIAPYIHTGSLLELPDEAVSELMVTAKKAVSILESIFHPEGYNIGINLGPVAGAGIPDHLHLHVVPRWKGDTNFMPVVGQTKVLNQSLSDTYKKLKEALSPKK